MAKKLRSILDWLHYEPSRRYDEVPIQITSYLLKEDKMLSVGMPTKEDMANEKVRRMFILSVLVQQGMKYKDRDEAIAVVCRYGSMFSIRPEEVTTVLSLRVNEVLDYGDLSA